MMELAGVATFVCAMIWMGVGGWAFVRIVQDNDAEQDAAGMLLIWCLVLAPFMAGMAFAYRQTAGREALSKAKEADGDQPS